MQHSFVAYIDESGDDGFKRFRQPGDRGGSSKWLIISACVFRKTHSLEAVGWRDGISNRMPERKSRILHFAELNHNQKLVVVQDIASRPLRAISIIAAKEPIPDSVYTEKNQLYFYMTRYLSERISWLCRDMRPIVPEGNGKVAITFSRRGGMSYSDFKSYMQKLKASEDQDVRIHWPVIDIDSIDAQDHKANASLQIADAIASSFAAGFEPDRYGNCESRYAQILKPITFHRNKNYFSYGVKIVPKHEEIALNEQQLQMIGLWK
ncbi:DUF3800 domain-containing protein [Bosea caraganae]|uniref:DUF3800 domain-containing protein n=2 Tax=Bosea caraganae TaxID=2763117 RepID=A0A370L8N8_9HYPH|nr:DUF3800 domain-containing protein [Bosea caraganae]RDJ30512.1 DUF3800 domain-containing protein [Bosea caraganae]